MAHWVLETVQPDGKWRQLWLQLSKSLKPQYVCMRLSPFKQFATYYAGHWRTDNIPENARERGLTLQKRFTIDRQRRMITWGQILQYCGVDGF